jgi:hypothetical protein
VGDIDEIERLLAVMTAANPRVSSFVAIPKGEPPVKMAAVPDDGAGPAGRV